MDLSLVRFLASLSNAHCLYFFVLCRLLLLSGILKIFSFSLYHFWCLNFSSSSSFILFNLGTNQICVPNQLSVVTVV